MKILHAQNHDNALEIFAKVFIAALWRHVPEIVGARSVESFVVRTPAAFTGVWKRVAKFAAVISSTVVSGEQFGEQFALPEAIGSLRSIRKIKTTGELVALSAADPLNLVGILTPGARIASVWKNRILLRDGVPVAGFEAGKILNLNGAEDLNGYERSLKIGRIPTALRRYY